MKALADELEWIRSSPKAKPVFRIGRIEWIYWIKRGLTVVADACSAYTG